KVCLFLGHNYIENSTFGMTLGGLKRGGIESCLNRIHQPVQLHRLGCVMLKTQKDEYRNFKRIFI
ncbi:MAG: hypothetical protein OEM27_09170, partial [Nitrospinota bacterium]|nr:hypothetical protein [Nitrospinota bacterium]